MVFPPIKPMLLHTGNTNEIVNDDENILRLPYPSSNTLTAEFSEL